MQLRERRLRQLFGSAASAEGPLARSGAALRLAGIDLVEKMSADQVSFLLDTLAHYRIVSLSGQDLKRFSLSHFERFANHWGAPVPHPSNFTRAGKPAQADGAADGHIELVPQDQRRSTAVSLRFPGQLECLPHTSPTVLVVANFTGERTAQSAPEIARGGSWHTDIEYELLPIYVSMFLVHHAPVSRDANGGTWVADPETTDPHARPYFEGSDATLMARRKHLPLNGETAFVDTAAAFDALPASERQQLEQVLVRRRLNGEDPGWLTPIVHTNPRSGQKSLHSPIWASRPRVRPPIEVYGMSTTESRRFLDDLESHVLQDRFRYDHGHHSGDVTLWDNTMTLHNSPPMKIDVDSIDDARLLYRLSCKGEPAPNLPRVDDPLWLETHIPGGYSTPRSCIDAPGAM